MIPGMTGAIAGGRTTITPPLLGVTVESATTSTTTSIAWPGSRVTGDVAVFANTSLDDDSPPTPSGFTSIVGGNNSNYAVRISYRHLDGSETGSISGINDSNAHMFLLLFRGTNRPILSVTPYGWLFNMNGTGDPRPFDIDARVHAGSFPRAVFGCLSQSYSGSAPNFTIETPSFASAQSLNDDIGGSIEWISRFERTIYARTDEGSEHQISSVTQPLTGGILAFG